jgi:hypothetical protein
MDPNEAKKLEEKLRKQKIEEKRKERDRLEEEKRY